MMAPVRDFAAFPLVVVEFVAFEQHAGVAIAGMPELIQMRRSHASTPVEGAPDGTRGALPRGIGVSRSPRTCSASRRSPLAGHRPSTAGMPGCDAGLDVLTESIDGAQFVAVSGLTIALRPASISTRPCASSRRSDSRTGMWLTPVGRSDPRSRNSIRRRACREDARRISAVTRSTADWGPATERSRLLGPVPPPGSVQGQKI